MTRVKGFTLVELMVIVALVAIMAAIAVPSFTDFMKKNEVQAAADDITHLLQFARTQAINTRSSVTVTKDTTNHKWVVTVRSVESRVLSYNPAKVYFDNNLTSNKLTFNPYGAADKLSKITICSTDKDKDNGYLLEVKRSGRLALSGRGGAPGGCQA